MLVSIQYGKDLGKMISIIDNLSLAEAGRQRMRWFMEQMPLIASLKETYRKEQPFRGLKVAICLHVEPKTAFWIDAILTGGAEHIYLVGCLGTTKPDTAAYLASDPRITVLAKEKDTLEDHQRYLEMVMEQRPDLFLDNGASLILAYHKKERDWAPVFCWGESGSWSSALAGAAAVLRENSVPWVPTRLSMISTLCIF